MDRRRFLKRSIQGAGALLLLGAMGRLLARSTSDRVVYQIDPAKCKHCGKCATVCVLTRSAVKNVNNFEKCGYCEYCYGYYSDHPSSHDSKKICPNDALIRKRVGEFKYEYKIDRGKCVGCGKCVARCKKHGNGSLALQIDRKRCVDCNVCAIAQRCPAHAISAVTVKS